MNNFKFTPGPWNFKYENFAEYSISHEIKFEKYSTNPQIEVFYQKENAQLASMAPEMLEQLIHILKLEYMRCNYKDDFKTVYSKQIAVIQKATGQTWEEISKEK